MATVVTHTIKPDGTGDFTSAAAWALAVGRDLIALDEIEDVECYSGNLGQLDLTTSSFVSDDTRFINIRAASGHEASADLRKASPVFYFNTASGGSAADISYQRCVVRGVRAHVHMTASSLSARGFYAYYSGPQHYAKFTRCVASFSYSLATLAGHPIGFSGQYLAIGCLAVAPAVSSSVSTGRLSYGFSCSVYDSSQTRPIGVVNCTAHGVRPLGTGISLLNTGGVPAYLVNCVVTGVGSQAFTSYSVSTSTGLTYGGLFVDGSTAASHILGAQLVRAKILDDANQRFGLAYNSPLIGAGINMSALADEDINGVAFPATGPWDVGCAQYTGPSASRARSPGRLPRFAMTPMNPARALANGANAGVVAKIGFFSLPPADVSVPVAPSGVGTGFAAGSPSATTRKTVAPTGVASDFAAGNATLRAKATVRAQGVPGGELIGTAVVLARFRVQAQSVPSAEAVGTPLVGSRWAIVATGLESGSAFGTPYLFIGSSARRRALSPWRDYAAESYLRYRSVVAALRAAGAESGGEERAVASPARITTVSSTDD